MKCPPAAMESRLSVLFSLHKKKYIYSCIDRHIYTYTKYSDTDKTAKQKLSRPQAWPQCTDKTDWGTMPCG